MAPISLYTRLTTPKPQKATTATPPQTPKPVPKPPAYVGPAGTPTAPSMPALAPPPAGGTFAPAGGTGSAGSASRPRSGGGTRTAGPARPTFGLTQQPGAAGYQGPALRPTFNLPGQLAPGGEGGAPPGTYAGPSGTPASTETPARYTGPVYATSSWGEVYGPSADMPLGARFKWYVDNNVPVPAYLETAGLSQPGGPGTAVFFNDGSYVRWDDPAVGGPGYGAPSNPETWLRQMHADAAARRATYVPRRTEEPEPPPLGPTEYGSF